MNGHEAARRIRALDRADAGTIPIIAMTANAFGKRRPSRPVSASGSGPSRRVPAAQSSSALSRKADTRKGLASVPTRSI